LFTPAGPSAADPAKSADGSFAKVFAQIHIRNKKLFTIRQYQPADWRTVIDLHKLALEQVGAYSEDRDIDEDLNNIEDRYLQNEGESLVGESEGGVIAIGVLSRTTKSRAEIKRMRVHPDHQRCGFGQAILSVLPLSSEPRPI
jgi:GNAT superfamily N-acetyltransferase